MVKVLLDTNAASKRPAGRPMPYADGQIAAIAAIHGLTLVTANAKDFRHVEGLRVEDWRA